MYIKLKKKIMKKKGITLSFLIRKIDGATPLTIAFFFLKQRKLYCLSIVLH